MQEVAAVCRLGAEQALLCWLALELQLTPNSAAQTLALGRIITAAGLVCTSLPAGCQMLCWEAANGKAGVGLPQILPLFTSGLSTVPAKLRPRTAQQRRYFGDTRTRRFKLPSASAGPTQPEPPVTTSGPSSRIPRCAAHAPDS